MAARGTERSPLLGQRSHSPSTSIRLSDAAHALLSPEAKRQNLIIFILSILLFFTCWTNGFTSIPLLRVLEDRICHEYYDMSMSPLEPIDESLCKEEWIQSRMAFILSINSAIGALSGFLAAFPWGAAADRIGRKPVLTIAMTGMALEVIWDISVLWFHTHLPIKLIWLGGVFNIIGGGNAIVVGMLFSIATDATTDENRAVAFLRLHVAAMAGSLISPTLCALLMERVSPWVCQWIGVLLLVFGSVAIYGVPNPPKLPHSPSRDEQESDSDEDPVNQKTPSRLMKMISLPITPSLFLFFLLILLSMPVALATQTFMSQYVSKRYHIKLASTGYIQSTYGVGHIVQAFVILPLVSHLLTSTSIPAMFRAKDEKRRDVILLRGSFCFLLVGLIAVGLARDLVSFMFGLVILVLGSGYASLLKSLMSLYADAKHRSRLFSLIGMVEVLARVYSDPALAGLYSFGLHHGGGWIGAPYFGVALLIAACLALLSFIKLPQSNDAVID
ncbi:unnamed protein product [Clonostachys rosea]|uniref:Major facilitator superfamily (MFS) profile domain-containing protein n=1 Tax=Bionectria ochroleuca TaxID=29856 RepID=A0ABY6UAU3_BIOOC|nr:unnamed protein product [Clonostachys rosea]